MVEVYVPAGEFKMGTNDLDPQERPIHNVYLDAYWIDQTEVTNGKYAKCVGAGVCGRPANENSYTRFPYFSDPMYADYPVIRVDWKQARDYCDWADGRLPTEAEWEKAARGTSERIFPWGPANPSDKLVNYNKSFGDTTVVSKFPDGASPYGALDMAGNVWEWVNDWYDPEYYSNSPTGNPQGPPSAAKRVLRGGAWNAEGALYIKTAYRHATEDYSNTISIGFRCVRP
jgi:serine/threonine-protein kinase